VFRADSARTFVPASLDPLLAGLTQSGAQIIDATRVVNPLSNWYFTAASTLLLVLIGWFLTDRIIEPRLKKTAIIDGDPEDMPKMEELGSREKKGLIAGLLAMVVGIGILAAVSLPESSPMRSPAGFKVSQASIDKLRTAGVPEDVLAKARPILEQEILGKTAFDNQMKTRLGDENAKQYGALFAQNAEPCRRSLPPRPLR